MIGVDFFRDAALGDRQYLTQLATQHPGLIFIEKALSGAVPPPEFLKDRKQVGFADLKQDANGVIRRGLLMLWDENNQARFSLSLRLALAYMRDQNLFLADGKVIGPGGKSIRNIQETSGAEVSIDDDGTITIYAANKEANDKAVAMVEAVSAVPEVGKTYTGVVKGVRDFGAFVEVMEGVQGLLHISELGDGYIRDINQHVKEGDEMKVVISAIDKMGKIRLVREDNYNKKDDDQAED